MIGRPSTVGRSLGLPTARHRRLIVAYGKSRDGRASWGIDSGGRSCRTTKGITMGLS